MRSNFEINEDQDRITITRQGVTYQLSISDEGLILDLVTPKDMETIFSCEHADYEGGL